MRESRKWVMWSALCLALVGLVVLAGCGGGTTTTTAAVTPTTSGVTDTTGGSTATTTVEASGDPIPVGFMAGFTGDMAPWAPAMANGAMVAVDEINAAGGVLGRPVQMFTEDDKSDVEGAVQGAQKLVNVNHVIDIVGPESNPIMALLDFAKENKVPIISTSAGTTGLDNAGGTGNYIYRTNAGDSFIGVSESWIVKNELKVDKLVIIQESTEGATSAAESFKKNFEKLGGTVMDVVVINPGQTKYSSEMKRVYDQNPPLVYMSASQPTSIALLKERFEKGYGGLLMGSSEIQTPETVTGAGVEAAKGLQSTRIIELTGTKGWDNFVKLYSAKIGEDPSPGYYQSNTYDAVILAALAMEAGKAATGEAIDANLLAVSGANGGTKVYTFAEGRDLLAKGEAIDYEGASGPVTFDQYGNISAAANALMQVDEKGEWTILKVINTSDLPAS